MAAEVGRLKYLFLNRETSFGILSYVPIVVCFLFVDSTVKLPFVGMSNFLSMAVASAGFG